MRKRGGGAAHGALKGVRVLVGRARHQASTLSVELRKQGATVVEIPFIEIRPPRSFGPLDEALRNIGRYDWLILTSVNGVEAMWKRMEKLTLLQPWKSGPSEPVLSKRRASKGPRSDAKPDGALAPRRRFRIAAIGPATKEAIELRGFKVDVVPKQYIAESVVRSLHRRVKGKRVLLVRAKVARDVIPRELRQAGACVDVVEAYETVVPKSSRGRLRAVLEKPRLRPDVITFTSSSTVRNFVALLGGREALARNPALLSGIQLASIGPVTSSTLGEFDLCVDVVARKFTIAALVQTIARAR